MSADPRRTVYEAAKVAKRLRSHVGRAIGDFGLIEDGDRVVIDVHARTLQLDVADEVLAERRAKMEASERPWQPRDRDRPVSKALRAYAALATSAHTGAVRRVP